MTMYIYALYIKKFFSTQELIFITTENHLIFQVRTLKPTNIMYLPKATPEDLFS